MRNQILIFILISVWVITGCKSSRPPSIGESRSIQYCEQRRDDILAGVRYAILRTQGTRYSQFATETIEDRNLRQKLIRLGTRIQVYYKSARVGDHPDSCVVFTSIGLDGTTDYVYDFAIRERSIDLYNQGYSGDRFYSYRICERIYYRKRETSLM